LHGGGPGFETQGQEKKTGVVVGFGVSGGRKKGPDVPKEPGEKRKRPAGNGPPWVQTINPLGVNNHKFGGKWPTPTPTVPGQRGGGDCVFNQKT